MKNIIAFSGTHGTGKSTCAYKLASDLKIKGHNIAVIDELARECPLKINQEADDLTQYWIVSSQLKREIELMSKYDYIISDRCIFDAFAYGIALELLDLPHGNLIAKYIKKYYHKIVVLNPETFNYHISDGIRDMDKEFRLTVHNKLLYLYNYYSIDYELVSSNEEIQSIFKTM